MKERLVNTIKEMMNESNNATIYVATTLLWNKEPASHEVSLLKREKEGAPIRVIEEDGEDVFVLPVATHDDVTHITIKRSDEEVVEFYPYEFDGEIVQDGKPGIEGRDVLKQLFAVMENEVDDKPSNNYQIQPNPRTLDLVEFPIGLYLPSFEVTLHPVNYTMKFFYGRQIERYGVLHGVAEDIPYQLHVDEEANTDSTFTDPAYKAFELFEDTFAAAVYLRMLKMINRERNPMWHWDGQRYPRLIMGTELAGRTIMIEVLEEADNLAGARINLQPFHDNRGEFARWLNSDGREEVTGTYERPNVITQRGKKNIMGVPGVYARVMQSQSADYHFVIGYLNAFKEKMVYLNVPPAYIETAMMTHAAELIHEFYHAARYVTDDKQKFDEWFATKFYDIIGPYYGAMRPADMGEVAQTMEMMADPVGLLFESVMKGSNSNQTFQPFYQTMIHFLAMMELSEEYNVRIAEVKQ